MTPEGSLKKEYRAYLDNLPHCWRFSPMMHGYGKRGVPDDVVCYRGFFFSIEAKGPGATPSAWQKIQIAAIVAAGGLNVVAYTLDEVKNAIRFLDLYRDELDALLAAA